MTKLHEHKIGDYRCVMYENKIGYTYKIFFRGKVVDQSYCYYHNKEMCFDKMYDNLDMFMGFHETLIERIK